MKRRRVIIVPADPIPQPRQRSGNGRAYLRDDDPIHAYKAAVRAAAQRVWKFDPPLLCPVSVDMTFYFPRVAKTHGKKTRGAPVTHGGDGDNLEKAIWDALQGIAFRNDKQVSEWSGRKRFADPGDRGCVVIVVSWHVPEKTRDPDGRGPRLF